MNIRFVAVLVALALSAGSARAMEPASGSIVEWTGGPIAGGGVFTVLTYAAPREMSLAETGLREAGLAAGLLIRKADEIRIFASREVMNAAPLARIWINAGKDHAYWFQTGGEGKADGFLIPKDAAVVVWTRASTNAIAWTNVFE